MSTRNVELIRNAYELYSRGDVGAVLDLVDPDLEWTYLDPAVENPQPQVCRGRRELAIALGRQSQRGLRAQLEEVIGVDDRVVVVLRTPGIEEYRVGKPGDRNFAVFTMRDGRIVALRDCHDRNEAMAVAGIRDL